MTTLGRWRPTHNLTDPEFSVVGFQSASMAPPPTFISDHERSLVAKPGRRVVRINIAQRIPVRLEGIVRRIVKLGELGPGWDSYGAASLHPMTIVRAIAWLIAAMEERTPLPDVVPTASGGLQFEWHEGGLDLEIEFSSDSRIVAVFEDESQGEEWEKEVTTDASPVLACLRKLTAPSR